MTTTHTESSEVSEVSSFWKRIFQPLFWMGFAALGVAFVMTFLARDWWFADLFVHFRVQQILLGLVLLGAGIGLGYRFSLLPIIVMTVTWGGLTSSYFPNFHTVDIPERAQSLMVWNVFVQNPNYDEILNQIRKRDADVVILLEVSFELSVRLGDMEEKYPYQKRKPSGDAFGAAVLSKQPVTEMTVETIGQELENTVLLTLEDGTTIVGAHTLPPGGARYSRIRNQQLAELAEYVQGLSGPLIVVGDLNITPWSPHYQDLLRDASLIDPRRGRGILTTWPSNPPLLRIPIDHILATEEIEIGELIALSGTSGSDHNPLFCRWWVREVSSTP